ncbi:MAG TPA: hypothetical protein VKV25_04820, partial [Acidimicrobiales bacterium]|nr:hypothetical protein [Acidimicrobiales bacterium]
CATRLRHFDEVAVDWFRGPELDALLVETVLSTFPPHEQEQFVAHYRGLISAWVRDEEARLAPA